MGTDSRGRRCAAVLALVVFLGLASLASPTHAAPAVEREVFGYLPYWGMDYDFPHWELLTTVAYFGVGMSADGLATEYHDWGTDAAQDLVDEAHANDVRLVVTIINFDDAAIEIMLLDPARRATAIETCLSLIAMHGADGVNIDFETVLPSAKSAFVTFMSDLKDAVDAAQPAGKPGHVTVAGPSIDYEGAYDFDQLLIHTDGIFIMGYDYHWATSDPGPCAPYSDSEKWGANYSVTWTVEDYLEWGGVENRAKIILGLPLYGHVYRVHDESVPGVNADPTYKEAWSAGLFEEQAATYGSTWDEAAAAVYLHREFEGHLVQAWNEDLTSIAMKMDLVTQYDLGGVGFWALGYEEGLTGFWTELEDQFGAGSEPEPQPDVVEVAEPTDEPDSATGEVVEPAEAWASEEVGPRDADGDSRVEDVDARETGPRAWRGRTHTEAVVSTKTESGCGAGSGPATWHLAMFALALAVVIARKR